MGVITGLVLAPLIIKDEYRMDHVVGREACAYYILVCGIIITAMSVFPFFF